MKKIFINYIFFTLLVMFCSLASVYAVNCEYVPIASVNEHGNYNAPTAAYTLSPDLSWMTERGYYIKLDSYNSGTSHSHLGGDDEVLDWTKKSCPNVIRVTDPPFFHWGDSYDWYGYNDLESAKKASKSEGKNGNYKDYDIFMILDTYLKKLQDEAKNSGTNFDDKVSYECSYDTFTIKYNKSGYALSANSRLDSISAQFFYYLSDDMKNKPVSNPGTCGTVHYCLTGSSGTTRTYTIFNNEADFNNNSDRCSEGGLVGKYDDSSKPDEENPEMAPDEEGKIGEEVGTCETIPEPIKEYINQALKLIRWIGLAAMIILGVLDFTKAVASDDQDALKKAWGHFTKRLIAVIILFILPLLIDLIMDLVDITTCKID